MRGIYTAIPTLKRLYFVLTIIIDYRLKLSVIRVFNSCRDVDRQRDSKLNNFDFINARQCNRIWFYYISRY